jgi:hypothetical protein
VDRDFVLKDCDSQLLQSYGQKLHDLNDTKDDERCNSSMTGHTTVQSACDDAHEWAECSKLADQRKQAKLQWLQNPSEANEDNLSDVRLEASRHFRNK